MEALTDCSGPFGLQIVPTLGYVGPQTIGNSHQGTAFEIKYGSIVVIGNPAPQTLSSGFRF